MPDTISPLIPRLLRYRDPRDGRRADLSLSLSASGEYVIHLETAVGQLDEGTVSNRTIADSVAAVAQFEARDAQLRAAGYLVEEAPAHPGDRVRLFGDPSSPTRVS